MSKMRKFTSVWLIFGTSSQQDQANGQQSDVQSHAGEKQPRLERPISDELANGQRTENDIGCACKLVSEKLSLLARRSGSS
jgi:hypothetical protein